MIWNRRWICWRKRIWRWRLLTETGSIWSRARENFIYRRVWSAWKTWWKNLASLFQIQSFPTEKALNPPLSTLTSSFPRVRISTTAFTPTPSHSHENFAKQYLSTITFSNIHPKQLQKKSQFEITGTIFFVGFKSPIVLQSSCSVIFHKNTFRCNTVHESLEFNGGFMFVFLYVR